MPSLLISATIPSPRYVSTLSLSLSTDCPLQEPKLSAARRIVAEWTDYDEEMFRLGKQIMVDRQEERQQRSGETREEL